MNWFKNLKISLKLYIGFGSVILMMILLVGISVYNITKTSSDYDWVLAFPASRFEQSSNIKADFIEVRRTVLAIAFYSDDNSNVEKNYADAQAGIVVINKNLDDYRSSVQSDPKLSDADKSTRMTNVDNLKSKINNEYVQLVTVLYNAAKASDETAMMQSVSDIGPVASDIRDIVDNMSEVATTRMAAETQTTSENADRQALLLIILSGIIVLFSASFSLAIGRSIRKPIVNLESAVRDISEGNLNVQIRSNSRDEIGVLSNSVGNVVDVFKNIVAEISNMYKGFELGNIDSEIPVDSFKGDYQQVVVAVNKLKKGLIADTLNFANAMGEVANGNFDANLDKLPGGRALLNEVLDNMQKNMQSINKDITYLIKSASMGELSAKVDASIYRGGWAEIINGLNELMKAIVAPIREVDAVLQQVSVGNFDNKVTGDYKGDFLLMKNSLNSTITNIASYIDEISAVLGAISRNDLDQRVTREYVGKFSDIKDALNNILNTLNDVIGDITSAAEQVNAGARAISESSMTLATGATEQASSVEELNATVLTINEGTQKNAKSALEAKELSDSCKSSADKGDRDMNNMLASMRSINDSSNSISKIIKVIDDIAFQTNLLALNAAVEAARAGTHGKGFAVVAEEVRTLAGRSQNAAKETADLIEESIARVNEGTKIADDTANTLRAIVSDVTKVADIITDIAEASNEQAYGIKQVTDGITQIAEVVQDNSATSEESASASQQLSSQAEVMRSLVAEFKLRR